MKASAIIVAAGSGTRLGLALPKAFVRIDGQSMLGRVLHTMRAVDSIGEVVIAAPDKMEAEARAEVSAAGLEIPVKITAGGERRQDSVRRALALTSAEAEIIVVHDAARPFATPAIFASSLQAVGAGIAGAIAAVPLADSLKLVDQNFVRSTVPRTRLWQAQTPQTFRREVLVAAHERAVREHLTATDDAELVEAAGGKIVVVEGSPLNLKVTTPDDLRMAEAIARSLFPR
ncbi:MAG TPA: 2-C-methyl-D-erythritol 4-phosphate cytidylyltransferase [Candidatus Binataceae bacterium]|nr:2-C-methyl-D-erythritol 4-phosphate cytidylyltransferase [Candidatus Binataceae bacterium]